MKGLARIIQRAYRVMLSYIGSDEQKRKYLIRHGAKIGDDFVLHGDLATFGTEPYLIEVGNKCLFAWGVKLLTHDGGIAVLNRMGKFGKNRADKVARIVIGNNVYLGMNAMVMPGVKIGDNVIVGANAVVTKSIPANSVAVGIPARVIESIDDYYEKCKKHVHYTAHMSDNEKRAYYDGIGFSDLLPEENKYGL